MASVNSGRPMSSSDSVRPKKPISKRSGGAGGSALRALTGEHVADQQVGARRLREAEQQLIGQEKRRHARHPAVLARQLRQPLQRGRLAVDIADHDIQLRLLAAENREEFLRLGAVRAALAHEDLDTLRRRCCDLCCRRREPPRQRQRQSEQRGPAPHCRPSLTLHPSLACLHRWPDAG
jgi:hypothetical protein